MSPPGAARLFVPPVCEGTARGEILAFEREKPAPPLPSPPDKGGLWILALFFFALFAWHYLRWNAPGAIAALPASPGEWVRLAGLDAYRTKVMGEWYRTVTALTLHADVAHVVGNIVLGAVFMVPLCRRIGPGMTLLLTLLAGAAANAVMVVFRPASSMTIGFSTALFSAVGLLSAIMAVHAFTHSMESVRALLPSRGKISRYVLKNSLLQGMLPFGAGLGVLAMLGGSDVPGVSYLSHCMGLFSGLAVGTLFARYGQRIMNLEGKADAVLQTAALFACVALLVSAWWPVLSR